MDNPPFCPNPQCEFHHPEAVKKAHIAPFRYYNSYTTLVAGTLDRFKCKACGRTFTERIFLLDYYTKKTLSYQEFHRAVSCGESLSAMAKHQHCSVASAQNRLERLSRNSLLFHVDCLSTLTLTGGLTADGFESFDGSQYHPNNINILVGTDSQFLYGFTHATLRRKGRMTDAQKVQREKIEHTFKPPRQTLLKAFTELLELMPTLWNRTTLPSLEFRTDEHRVYPRALQLIAVLREAMQDGTFTHKTYSSKAPRNISNELFPVNYMDREFRKDLAAYHRESVCFVRNVANGLARLMCYVMYHNYQKEFRIHWGKKRTVVHAVMAGVPEEKIREGLGKLYRERLFYTHHTVSSLWKKIWNREYKTPLKKKDEYLPLFVRV